MQAENSGLKKKFDCGYIFGAIKEATYANNKKSN